VTVRRLTAWRAGLGVAGAALIGFGVRGVLTGGIATAPRDTARWLVAGVLAHDLLLAPVVAVVGWTLHRTAPRRIRPFVQSGLFVAGAVVLVAIPVLTGRGGHGNASSNPLDYPRNLLLVLAAVAAGAALAAVAAVARSRWAGRRRPER
jgi:hypothetical protein